MVLEIAPDPTSGIRPFWSLAVAVQLLFMLREEVTEQHPTFKPRRSLRRMHIGWQRARAACGDAETRPTSPAVSELAE